MKSSIQTFGQILYSPSQYVIPVFQRNYRWESPQWAKLWDSVTEIQNPDKHGNHFMGFLVMLPELAQPGENTRFHLVDGQQRLTTSSILLAAVRNKAEKLRQQELADEINQFYLIHALKKGEQRYRILPKDRDHASYLAIINEEGHPVGRMAEALAYFEAQLASTDTAEKLRTIFYTVCQRLEFMCATLEAENAYNIFKSLNSTGVPLGPSDLIRNFVFMHVTPGEHDEFDREIWAPLEQRFASGGVLDEEQFSRFFRDYLMSSDGYVAPKDTFSTFETRFESTGFLPKELARNVSASSRHYMVITGREPDESDSVTKALQGLNVFESPTTYPLLMAMFQKRAARIIDSAQLTEAINMLRGFILRRFVCSESSRGYGQMFARGSALGEDDPVKALKDYLLERGWPDDDEFKSAFIRFPLYLRGYTREVLETLERERGHKEPPDLRDAQVEHILPQTLNDAWHEALGSDAERVHTEWLHCPGNLTLSAYNRELWNHGFNTKRLRYAESNISLTRDLCGHPCWGEFEIRERGRLLAEAAVQIWIGPKEKYKWAETAGGGDSATAARFELRRRFWSALGAHLSNSRPELPEFEARPERSIRLPSGIQHVGFEINLGLKQGNVRIYVWFWRDQSFRLWEKIKAAPGVYNELAGDTWDFVQIEGTRRGYMFIARQSQDLREESSWTEAQEWFSEKLSLLYERVAPRLRSAMIEI